MLKFCFWLTLHCKITCMVQDTGLTGHKLWSCQKKFNVCSPPLNLDLKCCGSSNCKVGSTNTLVQPEISLFQTVWWFGIQFMFPRGWIRLTLMIPLMADQWIPWGWYCYFPTLGQITIKPFIYSSQRIIQNDSGDLLTNCITFLVRVIYTRTCVQCIVIHCVA